MTEHHRRAEDHKDHEHDRLSDPILVQVLSTMNRIEEKVDHNESTAQRYRELQAKAFADHIEEETAEIGNTAQAINDITQSLMIMKRDLMDEIQKVNIVEALPVTKDGKPNIVGHRADHELREKRSEEFVNWLKSVLKDGGKVLLYAVLTFALYASWTAFLQGPK